MTRQYSRNSYADDHAYEDYPEYGTHDGDFDTDVTRYEFPADYHEQLDRRWIWVAGVAGVILMVAVICTGVILGGSDSGTVSATETSAEASPDAAAATTAEAPAPSPIPPTQQVPALAPETVTTVTPTPSATAAPEPSAQPAPPAPAAPAPVAAPNTITYTITGNKQILDLITVIYTDQQGALQTDLNVALPWSKTITLDPGVQLSSVTATSVGGQLNCSISDGAGAPLVVQANNTMITTCTK